LPPKVPITRQQSDDAVWSVIQAIENLHREGTYRNILDSLQADVVPKWLQYAFPSYQQGRRFRLMFSGSEPYLAAAMKALRQWARRYHLTRRENETCKLEGLAQAGLIEEDEANPEQPVEWALAWGLRICKEHEQKRRKQVPQGILPPDVQQSLTPVSTGTPGIFEASPLSVASSLPQVLPPGWLNLSLDIKGPLVATEGFGEFKKRLLPNINDKLKAIYQEAKARQQPMPLPKPAYRKKRQLDHYWWFVLFQCAGKSYAKIAEGYNSGDDTTIRKGVHRVALEVGVTLRGN
jgi:hypothetical protein